MPCFLFFMSPQLLLLLCFFFLYCAELWNLLSRDTKGPNHLKTAAVVLPCLFPVCVPVFPVSGVFLFTDKTYLLWSAEILA